MSSDPLESSWKSCSGFFPDCLAWFLRAETLLSCAWLSSCCLALFNDVMCFLHFVSRLVTLTFSLTRELRRSAKGPLVELFSFSKRSLIRVRALSTAPEAASSPALALSAASNGSSAFDQPSAAGKAFSTSSTAAASAAVASVSMVAAAFLSASSCLFFFSASMTSFSFFCAESTFRFRSAWLWAALVIRGRILRSCALVSARGPAFTAVSSSALWST
mmetsp:Transcript_15845/g.34665  ORF Transcript_15845/g.34665 Transcript_15845/m.34665 type:complete len:218 (-) Transcript_15845:2320-2973(-)